jgi:hypothetical protein
MKLGGGLGIEDGRGFAASFQQSACSSHLSAVRIGAGGAGFSLRGASAPPGTLVAAIRHPRRGPRAWADFLDNGRMHGAAEARVPLWGGLKPAPLVGPTVCGVAAKLLRRDSAAPNRNRIARTSVRHSNEEHLSVR